VPLTYESILLTVTTSPFRFQFSCLSKTNIKLEKDNVPFADSEGPLNEDYLGDDGRGLGDWIEVSDNVYCGGM